MARESDVVAPTLAGPEVGVASTKAFTCQLAVLACLAIAAGRARGTLSADDERSGGQGSWAAARIRLRSGETAAPGTLSRAPR
jgi:glucosamine--fructose-6-phosphate aminotransferase (isomerizing)